MAGAQNSTHCPQRWARSQRAPPFLAGYHRLTDQSVCPSQRSAPVTGGRSQLHPLISFVRDGPWKALLTRAASHTRRGRLRVRWGPRTLRQEAPLRRPEGQRGPHGVCQGPAGCRPRARHGFATCHPRSHRHAVFGGVTAPPALECASPGPEASRLRYF